MWGDPEGYRGLARRWAKADSGGHRIHRWKIQGGGSRSQRRATTAAGPDGTASKSSLSRSSLGDRCA